MSEKKTYKNKFAATWKLQTDGFSKRVTVCPQYEKQSGHGSLLIAQSAAADVARN
jgi:hypothetical protein